LYGNSKEKAEEIAVLNWFKKNIVVWKLNKENDAYASICLRRTLLYGNSLKYSLNTFKSV